MTANGDRPPDDERRDTDRPAAMSWKSPTLDLGVMPDEYRWAVLGDALRELSKLEDRLRRFFDSRIAAWERSTDRRLAAVCAQTAEETASRMGEKLLVELQTVKATAEGAVARASHAEIKADVAATGPWRALTVVNDFPTPVPPKSVEPPLERALEPVFGKRWAKRIAIAGVLVWAVASTIYMMVHH